MPARDRHRRCKVSGRVNPEDSPAENADQPKKVPASLGRRATRSLRKARNLYESNEWNESPEAAFLIREATIFALMDVAASVRELRADGEAA
jgi:hypothetical protein